MVREFTASSSPSRSAGGSVIRSVTTSLGAR
jgi:hypothetical protein